ncbi:MAG: ethanolamine ammonia-lyase subunit EutC [Deltaproteobacteria bacterium]|nr:ethanolamine ammonia-lyase subunit EutC [Deltaproteobacteria bacterium]
MDDRELKELVRGIVERELGSGNPGPDQTAPTGEKPPLVVRQKKKADPPEDIALAKRVADWTGDKLPPAPVFGTWRAAGDRKFYLGRTPARLGVGRAGVRYRTETVLSFLEDHAAARDAVHSGVDDQVITRLGLVSLSSAARNKEEFLLRPDLGRELSDESRELVKQQGTRSPQVQIVAADGLSATALSVNLPVVIPALTAQLQQAGIKLGTPFVITNARVACGDEVARITGADVLCLLVGERPGLKSAESMGVYVTYIKVKDFNESMRSVISNVHKGGLPPEQGARDMAALCLKALKDHRTGLEQ